MNAIYISAVELDGTLIFAVAFPDGAEAGFLTREEAILEARAAAPAYDNATICIDC